MKKEPEVSYFIDCHVRYHVRHYNPNVTSRSTYVTVEHSNCAVMVNGLKATITFINGYTMNKNMSGNYFDFYGTQVTKRKYNNWVKKKQQEINSNRNRIYDGTGLDYEWRRTHSLQIMERLKREMPERKDALDNLYVAFKLKGVYGWQQWLPISKELSKVLKIPLRFLHNNYQEITGMIYTATQLDFRKFENESLNAVTSGLPF